MIVANKEVIDFYNKIVEARRKIKVIRNPYNTDLTIYVSDKLIGTFTKEKLKEIGLIKCR